jgi:hypothetical protein
MRGDNVKTNDGHCGSNLSGKLSGQLFRDELSIGRSGRILTCDPLVPNEVALGTDGWGSRLGFLV